MCLRSDILDDKIEQRLSICGVQERFSSMTIPNSFCFETCLIASVPDLCILYTFIGNTFVTYYNFPKLIRKISASHNLFLNLYTKSP